MCFAGLAMKVDSQYKLNSWGSIFFRNTISSKGSELVDTRDSIFTSQGFPKLVSAYLVNLDWSTRGLIIDLSLLDESGNNISDSACL